MGSDYRKQAEEVANGFPTLCDCKDCISNLKANISKIEQNLRQAADDARKEERDGEVMAELVELDFENGTATFTVPDTSWTAGSYAIRNRSTQENEG